ncbi:MAG: 23S rRNA (uracil(1939)-C(5))-methyltransferase RlmD [Chlamydiales bacterium]|nr:23S rRNA (uracil(1939)-C(5))-methyltransferase RlmD [Chlamydiales bacterium]
MIALDQVIQGTITSLAFGGAGIFRYNHFVIFVPYTCIGEEVEVRIQKVSKNFATALLIKVLTPSKERIEARCPHFRVCPGCQIQHLSQAAQNHYKLSSVQNALCKLDMPSSSITFQETTKTWEYRRYIKLALHSTNNGFKMGYIAHDNKSLIEIGCCPIFVNEQNQIIQKLQTFTHNLDNVTPQKGSVTVFKADKSFILSFCFEKEIPKNIRLLAKIALQEGVCKGIQIQSANTCFSLGATHVAFSFEGLNILSHPKAFIQVHEEQSSLLYKKLYKHILASHAKNVLDLYCGIGITTLLLAKMGLNVIGIEKNREAVKLANSNKKSNEIQNVKFLQASVENVLEKTLSSFKADTVIINPPRTGIDKKVIQALGKARPKELIYISCMPSTLARDVSLLQQYGYHVVQGQAFDMFPQTGHVETLLILMY